MQLQSSDNPLTPTHFFGENQNAHACMRLNIFSQNF